MTYATCESTRQRNGESDIRHADRTFRPVFPGVHVCGADHDENRFFTVLNITARDDDQAKAMWAAARAEAEVGEEDGDLCVDLNTSEGHVDDFWTTRQMLPRLHAASLSATSPSSEQGRGS